MHVLFPRGIQASHSPPVGTTGPPTSQGHFSPPHRTSGLGHPSWSLYRSLPRIGLCLSNLSFPLSSLPGVQILTQMLLFPSYSIPCVSFLQPWLYRSPPASFQFVFSENCSTCRCILDMFMGGCEVHVLLLCHLGLNSGKSIFFIYKMKVTILFLTNCCRYTK